MLCVGNYENKQQLESILRGAMDLSEADISDETRICCNCNAAHMWEVATLGEDRGKLNAIAQRVERARFICNAVEGVDRVTSECVFAFVCCDIFIPHDVRICPRHLDVNGNIIYELVNGIW